MTYIWNTWEQQQHYQFPVQWFDQLCKNKLDESGYKMKSLDKLGIVWTDTHSASFQCA